MRYTPHFIVIRDAPGCVSHATLRAAAKPWKALATCTCTAGPLHAAQNVAKKAGYAGFAVHLVPKTAEDWQAATNGYLGGNRPGFVPTAITHIYRLVAP